PRLGPARQPGRRAPAGRARQDPAAQYRSRQGPGGARPRPAEIAKFGETLSVMAGLDPATQDAVKASIPAERLAVATLAERPELRAQLFSAEFAAAVPEFLRHDPTASLYYDDDALDRYVDFALVAVHPDEPDRVIARALSVPFVFRDGSVERAELPAGGWDAVIGWADRDWRTGRRPNAVSALEIMVLPPYRGRGLAQSMLAAMCANTRAR